MEENKERVAGITQQHLNAISYPLYFYEQYLWRFTTPSVRRTRQIVEVQLLVVKVQLLATSKIGMFTPSEVEHIESAIRLFTAQAAEKIPQSESRDAVIEGCEALREYLVKTLTLPDREQYL